MDKSTNYLYYFGHSLKLSYFILFMFFFNFSFLFYPILFLNLHKSLRSQEQNVPMDTHKTPQINKSYLFRLLINKV